MVRSRRLLGLPVIDIENGRSVGRVSRIILDPRARRVSAFVVASGRWPAEDHVLEWGHARGVGQAAITIRGSHLLARPAALPELQPLLRRPLRLYGTRVLTEDGEFLGTVEELIIDAQSGEVTQIILSPNGLAQRLRGHPTLEADAVLVMGEDAMVVRAGTRAQPPRSARPNGAAAPAGAQGQAAHPAGPATAGDGSHSRQESDPGSASGSHVGRLQYAARQTWQALRRLAAERRPPRDGVQ